MWMFLQSKHVKYLKNVFNLSSFAPENSSQERIHGTLKKNLEQEKHLPFSIGLPAVTFQGSKCLKRKTTDLPFVLGEPPAPLGISGVKNGERSPQSNPPPAEKMRRLPSQRLLRRLTTWMRCWRNRNRNGLTREGEGKSDGSNCPRPWEWVHRWMFP